MIAWMFLAAGLLCGVLIGWLIAQRKATSQLLESRQQAMDNQALLAATQREVELLNRQIREAEERNQSLLREAEARAQSQLQEAEARYQRQLQQMEQRHTKQQEEQEALQQTMAMTFENLSNRVLKSRTEEFRQLNADHLQQLLQPLAGSIKEFKQQVEQAYATEAKERFSLAQHIKELVALNNRLSEEADNLTRALKGDSKVQGNWGEMILERLLEASGLIEGEHYVRQEFLKNERGEALLNEESGQKMQPDVVVRFPDERELIIDSKVSLTAYAAYTTATDKEEQTAHLKAHLRSIRAHVDELSVKD